MGRNPNNLYRKIPRARAKSALTPCLTAVDSRESEINRWFSEEVHPHESMLRAWLRNLFPSLHDVDDIVQDSYIRLIRAKKAGKVGNAKGYLFSTARNAARDVIRHQAVADAWSITETVPWSVLEDGPGVVDQVSRRQELALLAEAIYALPERCRQVFLLKKIQGLSQKEIAARLGITENTVETLVAKGAHRCADYLRAHGVGAGSNHAT